MASGKAERGIARPEGQPERNAKDGAARAVAADFDIEPPPEWWAQWVEEQEIIATGIDYYSHRESYGDEDDYNNDEDDCEFKEPWDDDPEMKQALDSAAWRFAYLIGLVDASDSFASEDLDYDARTYPHFRKTELISDGKELAVWDYADSGVFMHKLTGIDVAICNRWVKLDWH